MALLQITWPDYKQTCHAHSSFKHVPHQICDIWISYIFIFDFILILSYMLTYVVTKRIILLISSIIFQKAAHPLSLWYCRMKQQVGAHTLCTLLHFMRHQRCRLQLNSVLLKWLVEHQFLLQTREKEMQLVLHTLLHLTKICTVCFARLLASTS